MKDEIIGTHIGIYDVLYECDYKSNDGHKIFHVKCTECGYETDMQLRHIKSVALCKHKMLGNTYINTEVIWSNKRIGSIFRGMKARCYTTTNKDYKNYGEKGIKICQEWLSNPKLFEEWALANGYNDNLTIDRINGDKDYCPENCRWITLEENSKNKPTTNFLTVDGETHTGREWSRILCFNNSRINQYVDKYGKENVEEFIKKYLEHPGEKPKSRQSYYDLYMHNDSISST